METDNPDSERLERLKNLVEKRKKEVEQAKKLIRKTQDEIQQKKFGKINIPDEEVSIDRYGVMVGEEKKGKKEIDVALEETVAEAAPKRAHEEPTAEQQEYINALAERPIEELTNEIYKIASSVGEGTPNEEQVDRIYTIQNALYEKNKAITKGDYDAPDLVQQEVTLDRSLANTLMKDYESGKQLYKGGAP